MARPKSPAKPRAGAIPVPDRAGPKTPRNISHRPVELPPMKRVQGEERPPPQVGPPITIGPRFLCHGCGARFEEEEDNLACPQCGEPRAMVEDLRPDDE